MSETVTVEFVSSGGTADGQVGGSVGIHTLWMGANAGEIVTYDGRIKFGDGVVVVGSIW